MSQAFVCDGCSRVQLGVAPSARCTIRARLGGTALERNYEYCATCADVIGDQPTLVDDAQRRLVTPQT